MTMEYGLIGLLALLMLLQQGFYMWQMHRMINKLMSKNFAEYAQINHLYKDKPQALGMNIPLPEDHEMDRLSELNKMMGMRPI